MGSSSARTNDPAWDPLGEWIGRAVPATGQAFPVALTATVVRHADGTLYRVRWSVRDISLRPGLD
ncbi:MAG TPA: hypothetical protein VFM14_01205 [Gemmatimonadales bacterium]|nr:hypothetical protein [Gemmatimonadales bacterium]